MTGLTHFDASGQAHMVDVSDKAHTDRIAVAEGYVKMTAETLDLITDGRAKKGDVLSVARLAGIMGAKKTSDLIPLCHPLPITKVAVELTVDPSRPGIRAEATVKTPESRTRACLVMPRLTPNASSASTIAARMICTAVLALDSAIRAMPSSTRPRGTAARTD